jgi:hypothetical protein
VSAWGQDLRDLTRHLVTHEPEEIRALRTGTVEGRPGSYGQWGTTWYMAHAVLLGYSMNLYQQLRMAANKDLPVDSVMTMLQTMDPIYSGYLEYNGFGLLQQHAEGVRRSSFADRAALVSALSALTEYVNRLTAWSHHWYPWSSGDSYRYRGAEPCIVPARPPVPDVMAARSAPARRVPIRLAWEPLGVEVRAEIATDLNPVLCADVLAALPFTVLQDHAVVSGHSMYAWAPLVSVAHTPVTEPICDAPFGRLRFSQATGCKVVIQYGPTTEPLPVPVLGAVIADDLDILAKVGPLIWDSTYQSKKPIWLTVELAS